MALHARELRHNCDYSQRKSFKKQEVGYEIGNYYKI